MRVLLLLGFAFVLTACRAEVGWQRPTIGSWIRAGKPKSGDVNLVWSQIVVRPGLGSNVLQAGRFLQSDLEKLTGRKPPLSRSFQNFTSTRILIEVAPNPRQPESYRIRTDRQGIVVTGADDRGAAFGIYELSERLGVDPLYIWSGIEPKKLARLVVEKVDFIKESPTFTWRGLFHDDEDVLPRPILSEGYPDPRGTVPKIWYERYFESALRLRMNMVAPWVRTQRNYEIQKLASDWGLAYTSHHYDILLSDPYRFDKGLAQKRGVTPKWDWLENRDGIQKYWQAGVEENKALDAIYPIGLRGTNDYGYRFPGDWTQDRKIAAYNEVLQIQAEMVDRLLPSGSPRLMHFTMYTEMLPFYQTGKLKVPSGAIIVWPDDNDGRMRGLPEPSATGKHGVYYHLAYLGGRLTKQVHQTIPPERIQQEFSKILEAGATDYALVNVSEIREYAMGIRFIAGILWDGKAAIDSKDFLDWWCREYFGTRDAVQAVKSYFGSIGHPADLGIGGTKCVGALASLEKKFAGEAFVPAAKETLPMLEARADASRKLRWELERVQAIVSKSKPSQSRFFFENIELPANVDRLNTLAAIALVRAMAEPNRGRALALCRTAMNHLNDLRTQLMLAERPPFGNWYGPTWIRERTQVLVEPRLRLEALLAKHR
jgi:hypothetical protein